jgi:diacylglycerol kinase
MKDTLNSFKYAINGIKDAINSEPNLSVHLLFAVIALIFAYFMKLTNNEFMIFIIIIFAVITLELINTVVEKIVDLHSLKISEEARQIKDISAAIVLLGAICSTIVALFLFLPKLI